MDKLPLARHADIVVQQLDREILVYDLKTHKAFNLNETSAAVYQSCDGKTSFDELRVKHRLTDDLIFLALDELRRENLIEDDKSLVSPFAGMSRREAIKKVGLGTMIALPLISSLLAPTAAQAQSGNTCSETTCTCSFSDTDTNTTCTDAGSCEVGCTCQTSRPTACSPGEVDGTVECFGNCGSVPVSA